MTGAEPAPMTFRFGPAPDEHLALEIARRTLPDATDYWDANWLAASVRVRSGPFRGEFGATLRIEELATFRSELARLHRDLGGSASLRVMERWLAADVRGDGRGHFTATCEVRDDRAQGTKLSFELRFDQTELPAMLADLDALLEAFPIVGRP